MNLPQLFGKNVRLRRNELGLSQERLRSIILSSGRPQRGHAC